VNKVIVRERALLLLVMRKPCANNEMHATNKTSKRPKDEDMMTGKQQKLYYKDARTQYAGSTLSKASFF